MVLELVSKNIPYHGLGGTMKDIETAPVRKIAQSVERKR
jgi:hypothetical protein